MKISSTSEIVGSFLRSASLWRVRWYVRRRLHVVLWLLWVSVYNYYPHKLSEGVSHQTV